MTADEQLVRTITDRVLAQVQAQITGMHEKITKLEEKLETETNKRMHLEEELRRFKEHPPQKFFLRNYATGDRREGESNGFSAGETGTSLLSSFSIFYAIHSFSVINHLSFYPLFAIFSHHSKFKDTK